jgi:hypothetical protein
MLKNKTRVSRSFGLLAVVALFAALLPGSAAQAIERKDSPVHILISRDCIVSTPFGSCTSGSVAADSNHRVGVSITTANGGCSYRVVDVNNNNAVVRSGTVPIWQFANFTLYNVYSRYQLKMTCVVAGYGQIFGA